jgi:hypothetical protein
VKHCQAKGAIRREGKVALIRVKLDITLNLTAQIAETTAQPMAATKRDSPQRAQRTLRKLGLTEKA